MLIDAEGVLSFCRWAYVVRPQKLMSRFCGFFYLRVKLGPQQRFLCLQGAARWRKAQ